MLELDERIGGGEAPINGYASLIAFALPGSHVSLDILKRGQTPIQTLTSQCTQFDLGQYSGQLACLGVAWISRRKQRRSASSGGKVS